jgi:hypothetical protein
MNKKEQVFKKLNTMSVSELEKITALYKLYLKNDNKKLIEGIKNYEKK